MNKFLASAALFALILCAAPASADDAATMFGAKCAVCHGKDGTGNNPMGKKLAVKDLNVTKMSAAEIEKIVAEGKGKMTPFRGKISDEEIKALAAFVKAGLK